MGLLVRLFSFNNEEEVQLKMTEAIPYLGEMMALTTAVVWAFGVILFKRSGEYVHPIALNTYKNILAGLLFIPTIYLFGETLFYDAPIEDYLLLFLSGALGIGIADTLFFKSLNYLGASLTAIIDCLYSPSIIFLAFIWLGESMSVLQLIGAILIISAILAAATKKGRGIVNKRDFIFGLIYGTLGMLTMGVGIVMIKPLLERSPLIWSTEMRMIGGLLVLIVNLILHPRRKAIIMTALDKRVWKDTLFGSILGTYVALIFWLGGMKYTQASTAAALNQTSNIFIFVFAAVFLKERLTTMKTMGIVLAMIGAYLVITG